MTMDIIDIKELKDNLEKDIEKLLHRFERTTGFIVTDVKMTRHLIENTNFPKNNFYNIKIGMTL